MYQVKSPILFLVFNRPIESKSVFEAIRMVKPEKLYFAADGPRNNNPDDIENCAKTQKLIEQIDWPCQVQLLLRKENLGCGLAVSEAITWFFHQELEGIILEDDCLPTTDFFRFCDIMLKKYKDDNRIGHVSGTNIHDNIKRGDATYFFSRLTAIWGWATWARVWKDYDYHLSKLEPAIKINFLEDLVVNKRIQKSLLNDFIKTKSSEINTWDYQYFFMHVISNRLSIFPNSNLISNIGFGKGGTHTLNSYNLHSAAKTSSLGENIIHPIICLPDKNADLYALQKAVPTLLYRSQQKLIRIFKSHLQ